MVSGQTTRHSPPRFSRRYRVRAMTTIDAATMRRLILHEITCPRHAVARGARPRRCCPAPRSDRSRTLLEPARGDPLAGRRGRVRPAIDGDAGAVRLAWAPAPRVAVAAPRLARRPGRAPDRQRVPRHRSRLHDGPGRPGPIRGPAGAPAPARRRDRAALGGPWATGRRRGDGDRRRPVRRVRRRQRAPPGGHGRDDHFARPTHLHALPRARGQPASRSGETCHVRRDQLPVVDRDGDVGTRAGVRPPGDGRRVERCRRRRQRVDASRRLRRQPRARSGSTATSGSSGSGSHARTSC